MAEEEAVKQKKSLKEMLDSLSKRETILGYVAGFFIVLLVLDSVILKPIINKIEMLKGEIVRQITLTKDGLMIIDYKEVIEGDHTRFSKYLVDKRRTEEEELADFLKSLENLAMESGIHIVTLSPTEEIDKSKLYTKYEVKTDLTGTMEQMIKFLYKISIANVPTRVESVEFIPPSKADGDITFNMLISRIFVEK